MASVFTCWPRVVPGARVETGKLNTGKRVLEYAVLPGFTLVYLV